ncbi:deaminase [Bifidobacterium aemilianum]|uniref:Deaminase n=1 Tax=Bifidobacterium aemilianum TaxID=2493120 RepID=A0A366KB71_9BIFI|nr:dihydrofolate reductase family protein [Bifidobacterium aemilianum]RBP98617.1 deaminase [Bifidobacterium aemilianum]
MDRAQVTIHMLVSIDGKIDGPYERQPDIKQTDAFYNDELFKLGSANANGATTVATYNAKGTLDLSGFSENGIEYEDWLPDIHADTWQVSLDRKGRMGWEVNYNEYGGRHNRVIEVVSKKAPKAYLAFLRSMEIPYLIGGEEDLDLELVLTKLKASFNIDRLVISGGSIINGAFLKARLVDQISLVVLPYVSGDSSTKSSFDTMGEFIDDHFSISSVKQLADGGLTMIFSK